MITVYSLKNSAAFGASLALMMASAPAMAIDGKINTAPPASVLAQSSSVDGDVAPEKKGGFLSGIFGCQADGEKQIIGAAAGTALGGLLGNRIAGRGSRTLGTLLGGALGAAAGSVLGCKLQKNDQTKAERAAQEALATGKNQTWESDETGASGRIDVSQSAGGSLADLKLANQVEPASAYTKVGKSYTATAAANIRTAPNTKAASLGKLSAGQLVYVPAAVKGSPWLLISSNGIGQGYVSAPLLKPAVTSAAASGCKIVKQTVSTPGAADESETLQACKGSDGAWVMTRV